MLISIRVRFPVTPNLIRQAMVIVQFETILKYRKKSPGTIHHKVHWHRLRTISFVRKIDANILILFEFWRITFVLGNSFSSNTSINRTENFSDRRISIPDMSKISTSSAAVVASVGPTIDKLKQWSRTRYKCTKQSIFEKLGKTSKTVDVELDSQIEVKRKRKRKSLPSNSFFSTYVKRNVDMKQC